MTFAGAIFLIAVGAIVRYATHFQVAGVEEGTVGLILMVAGAVGFIAAIFEALIWNAALRRRNRGYDDSRRYRTY